MESPAAETELTPGQAPCAAGMQSAVVLEQLFSFLSSVPPGFPWGCARNLVFPRHSWACWGVTEEEGGKPAKQGMGWETLGQRCQGCMCNWFRVSDYIIASQRKILFFICAQHKKEPRVPCMQGWGREESRYTCFSALYLPSLIQEGRLNITYPAPTQRQKDRQASANTEKWACSYVITGAVTGLICD